MFGIALMDESLAKGLTKRFFREYNPEIEKLHGQVFSDRKKSSQKKIDFRLNQIRRKAPHLIVHSARFGSKKQRCVGWTFLASYNDNDAKGWEEALMLPATVAFIANKEQEIGVQAWCISHHAIQRIFQRKNTIKTFDLNVLASSITAELDYVAVIAFVLGRVSQRLFDSGELAKSDVVEFVCPTLNGLFLCELHCLEEDGRLFPQLYLRSWISVAILRAEQTEVRRRLIARFQPFLEVHYPYEVFNRFLEKGDNHASTFGYLYILFLLEFISDFDDLFVPSQPLGEYINSAWNDYLSLSAPDVQSSYRNTITELGWELGYEALCGAHFKRLVKEQRADNVGVRAPASSAL